MTCARCYNNFIILCVCVVVKRWPIIDDWSWCMCLDFYTVSCHYLSRMSAKFWWYETLHACCEQFASGYLSDDKIVSVPSTETEVSLLLDPEYGMLSLQNYDTTSALDFLGANWSRIRLSRALNLGALWHIVFLPLKNILTYFLIGAVQTHGFPQSLTDETGYCVRVRIVKC